MVFCFVGPVLHALDDADDRFSDSAKEDMKEPTLEITNTSDLLKILLYFRRNSD